jgi:hypothetical protein
MASGPDTIGVGSLADSASDVTTTETLKVSQTEIDLESAVPTPVSAPDCVTVIGKKGHYKLAKQYRLKNSLLAGVGFLELANAGDFAANVWNQTPVPRFAIALMVLGGTLALAISHFAFRDAKLSRRNVLLLQEERRYLQTQKADLSQSAQSSHDLDCQLDVNFREMGTEIVDRIGMDIVMGFGAVVVGTGTFMAIGGTDPVVYQASNLLSGYIGNAPVALYGLVNAGWSAYVWRRAHRHGIAGEKELKADITGQKLQRRIRTVKAHAAINGVTGIVAGAASLVTATMWYGYPVLVVCIISSVLCNYFWRHRIGYDRPLVRQTLKGDKISISEELRFVTTAQQVLDEAPSESLVKLGADPNSTASILEFLIKNDLFEDFCIRLLKDTSLSTSLFGALSDELTIDPQMLLRADALDAPRFLEIAQTAVSEMGLIRFQYRERYLLEAFGCYLCSTRVETISEKC